MHWSELHYQFNLGTHKMQMQSSLLELGMAHKHGASYSMDV